MGDQPILTDDGGKKIQAIKEGVNKAEAEEIKKKIKEAGGTVEVK